jgi:hypothetical protein
MNRQILQFVAAGMTLIVAMLSPGGVSSAEDGRLIIDEGFESRVLPFKPSGNAPVVVRETDARAGKYVERRKGTGPIVFGSLIALWVL